MNTRKIIVTISRLANSSSYFHQRYLSQTSKLCSFFERDHRGGEFPLVIDKTWQEMLKETSQAIIPECKKFWKETKDHFQQDRKLYNHGDTDVFWRFDSEDCLKQWRVSSDKLNKLGSSVCTLTINDQKKAVFSGNVDLTLPNDGKTKFTGFCGIRSTKKMKSFFREDFYEEFENFTHLELRVRGDGRNYAIHLHTGMYVDVNWFSTWTYSLYTHGGPYWQVVRIPFSKFFLQSKGRVQDRQCRVPLSKINSIGILCAGVAGPFKLEIDYIGCHIDWSYKEKFAYEMYKIPKEFVSY